MSSSTDPFTAPDHAAAQDARADALFDGDLGALEENTRRALVQLLRGPWLDARSHEKLWVALLRDEQLVRSRLHELFLELTLERDQGVAFTRQVVAPEVDAPILLRRATLSYFDSALVIFLRQQLTRFSTEGTRPVVSADEMRDHLLVLQTDGDTDHARFRRRMDNAIERCEQLGLLRQIRGSPGRFEISPTLKLLFGAEQIQALSHALLGAAADDAEPDEQDSAIAEAHERSDE